MIPFGEWLGLAGGHLGWSEAQFWSSSPVYFLAAWRGYLASRGVKESTLTSEGWEKFKREHAAELAMTTEDLKRLREARKRSGNGTG